MSRFTTIGQGLIGGIASLCCCGSRRNGAASTNDVGSANYQHKAQAAVGRIRAELGTVAQLQSAITAGNIQSCASTSEEIIRRIANGSGRLLQCVLVNPTDLIGNIDTEISNGNILLISIANPDHHFVVLAANTTDVYVLQSFQTAFNLSEWLQNNSYIFDREHFLFNLRCIVSSDASACDEGARNLFSFDGRDETVSSFFRISTPPNFSRVAVYSF